jgi:hypothetical protein
MTKYIIQTRNSKFSEKESPWEDYGKPSIDRQTVETKIEQYRKGSPVWIYQLVKEVSKRTVLKENKAGGQIAKAARKP